MIMGIYFSVRKCFEGLVLIEGSTEEPIINWPLPSGGLDGLLHSHYFGYNSIFSPEDVIFMAQIYVWNRARNPSNLFYGLTSSYGMPYLMKVGDETTFRDFAVKIVGENGTDVKKMNFFRNKFYDNINSDNQDKNEKEFLKLLKNEYSVQNGLILYRGNNECNQWTRIKIDGFNDVIPYPCN